MLAVASRDVQIRKAGFERFVALAAQRHGFLYGLTAVILLLLLGRLVLIYLRLDIGRAVVPRAERWLVHLPFSVYLGWITVATIANASILLTHLGWNGEPGGAQFWTLLVMAAAVAIALWATFGREDFAYALVILGLTFIQIVVFLVNCINRGATKN